MALEEIGGAEPTSGISRLTTEYLYWHMTTEQDFSGDTAEVAFMPQSTTKPGVSDWTAADIVTNPDDGAQNSVRLLVGPGGAKDLTPVGDTAVTYSVWIRITTVSETFVRRAGTLLVR